MIFRESGLVFEFDPGRWIVKAFDDHPYYRALSGHGFKGVDFIGLLNGQELVCVEVKNYRRTFPDHPSLLQEFLLQEQAGVLRKMEDTLRILDLIHQYYRRKWGFRYLDPIFSHYPAVFREWGFWSKAKQIHSLSGQCRFVWYIAHDTPDWSSLLQALPTMEVMPNKPLHLFDISASHTPNLPFVKLSRPGS